MARVVYIIVNHDSGQAYAGLTKQFDYRMWQHRRQKPHLFAGRHEILKTVSMTDAAAQRTEARAISFLKSVGFHTVNINKAGCLGGPIRQWTKRRCAEEALKYSTRNEFALRAPGARAAAQRKGWMDDVCGHMKNCDPMRYLKLRGSRWQYARRVPEQFSHIDNRGTIHVSLKTKSLEIAQLRRDEMERADDLFWRRDTVS